MTSETHIPSVVGFYRPAFKSRASKPLAAARGDRKPPAVSYQRPRPHRRGLLPLRPPKQLLLVESGLFLLFWRFKLVSAAWLHSYVTGRPREGGGI